MAVLWRGLAAGAGAGAGGERGAGARERENFCVRFLPRLPSPLECRGAHTHTRTHMGAEGACGLGVIDWTALSGYWSLERALRRLC